MTHRHLTAFAAVLLLAAAGCGETRPATGSANDCSACHGFPPATLTSDGSDHPQADAGDTWVAADCSACHVTTVDATGEIVPGGTHADGKVDGRHAIPYPAAVHGPAANAYFSSCRSCHGADLLGGTSGRSCGDCHEGTVAPAFTNCTLCHGTRVDAYTGADLQKSAPPADVAGLTAVTEVTVGVHQTHITAPNNPLACGDCHSTDGSTPADVFAAGHIDGGPAEVPFGPLARTGGRAPTWNRTEATCSSNWCHDRGGSVTSWTWTAATTLDCASCHPAQPTAAAHPAHVDGETLSGGFSCATCHPGTGSYPNDHLDGTLDVVFDNAPVPGGTYADGTCSSVYCHGNFTGGNTANAPTWSGTAACGSCHPNPPTTGRHTTHISVYGRTCADCHAGYTPTTVDQAVHVNGAKDVEVTLSRCTSCHPGAGQPNMANW